MRKRTILIGLGALLAVALVATPIVLAPGQLTTMPPAEAVAEAEQAQTIEAMRPPKRERPVIAIATFNQATEVTDFLVSYGVLKRADVADVTVVAENDAPVQLYPSRLSVEPEETMAAFDQRNPDGADYVVVPAMEPVDPFVTAWVKAQYDKGAKIISICNGAKTMSAAGLLDGHRATGHWSFVPEMRQKHPTMQWIADRRYVADDRVTTTTGITASVPAMLALVEAIDGRATAERVASELGVADWDSRHRSAAFELTGEHKKTFIRNTISFWRHETIGVPLVENVDEIALGLTADAYARTQLANVVTVGPNGTAVRSLHGLTIHPDQASETARVDDMLPAPSPDQPAQAIERELPRIAARYDRSTAGIVALVMEYPWTENLAVQ